MQVRTAGSDFLDGIHERRTPIDQTHVRAVSEMCRSPGPLRAAPVKLVRQPDGMIMLSRRCVELERLIGRIGSGSGGSLVVRGEAGVGKTTLVRRTLDGGPACRVVRVAGVEAEKDLPFAAIHQLWGQISDGIERLPGPQAEALRAAFGLTAASLPDHFLLGLAVRGLLADAAEQRPVVCVVDDAQWLDGLSARTLAFVARRLDALAVGVVFGVRGRRDELVGLPDVELHGLSAVEARSLIDRAIPGPCDDGVRARLVSEAEGNPVAIVELLTALQPGAIAGGFGSPTAIPLPPGLEEPFFDRLERLPEDTRQVLLVAAAEPLGRPSLLWRAADILGIPAMAARPAEEDGLLRIGASVRFGHPGMRSAVYLGAPPAERDSVHRALAEATDPVDVDWRAWHRGYASSVLDEEVAVELQQAAGRVQVKGGLAAAAALLDRAAALTPEPARRSERMLAAGQAKLAAGAVEEATELLGRAESRLLEKQDGAQLELLLAQVVAAQGDGCDGPSLLLSAAQRLELLDADLARETYLVALYAAIHADGLCRDSRVVQVALAARGAPPAPEPPRTVDLLLEGLVALFADGYAVAVPLLKQALRNLEGEKEIRWLAIGSGIASFLWDDGMARALATRQRELAFPAGALTALQWSLLMLAPYSVYAGDFAAAADLIEQAGVITTRPFVPDMSAPLMLAAFGGREAEASQLIETTIEDASIRGEGRVIALGQEMTAVLHNSLGNYRQALIAAQHASDRDQLGVSDRALAELVEAAVHCGQPEIGAAALQRLSERTRLCETDWALGVEARSRALLSQGDIAERLYRIAIERLGRCSIVTDLARSHLVYGEWLRRDGRRMEARDQLRLALEMFTAMGAQAFAERTERELQATGERLHKRGIESDMQLTFQEAQISRLARAGHSNPEIAGKLYISPRTVEYHLRKVFRKLGISSRNQLHRVLDSDDV